MRKLDQKYFTFVFATFMSILVPGIMAFCIAYYERGFTEGFVKEAMEAWKYSLPFAFVAAQLVAPLVRKITISLVER